MGLCTNCGEYGDTAGICECYNPMIGWDGKPRILPLEKPGTRNINRCPRCGQYQPYYNACKCPGETEDKTEKDKTK